MKSEFYEPFWHISGFDPPQHKVTFSVWGILQLESHTLAAPAKKNNENLH